MVRREATKAEERREQRDYLRQQEAVRVAAVADPRLAIPRPANPRLAHPRLANPRLADPRLADLRLADPRLADLRLADSRLAIQGWRSKAGRSEAAHKAPGREAGSGCEDMPKLRQGIRQPGEMPRRRPVLPQVQEGGTPEGPVQVPGSQKRGKRL